MYKSMENDIVRLEMLLKVKESMLREFEAVHLRKPFELDDDARKVLRVIDELNTEIMELTFGYEQAQNILGTEKEREHQKISYKTRWCKPNGEVLDFESLESCAEHVKTVYGLNVAPYKTISESARTGLPWIGYGRFIILD